MYKLAPQADLGYNRGSKLLWLSDVGSILSREHNLVGGYAMDTLSPHADNGNLSSRIPKASGIYKIACIVTGKFYIGSTSNLYDRRKSHLSKLRRNEHGNPKLQAAWNKYGEASFTYDVLELVLPMSLTAREQYWIDKLKPLFNLASVAGSRLGIKDSPETREKIRQSKLGRKNPTRTFGGERDG